MSKKIALTITPPYRSINKLYRNPNRMLFDEDADQIHCIMKYNKIKGYIIYPEFSEKGRLHYHGILTLNPTEYIRFHKHAIHKLKLIGFVDITIIKEFINNLRYVVYMSKEWGVTREILEINQPIMYRKLLGGRHQVAHALDDGIETKTIEDYFNIKKD